MQVNFLQIDCESTNSKILIFKVMTWLVQSTEILATYNNCWNICRADVSRGSLSAHGTHSAYSRTPAGATADYNLNLVLCAVHFPEDSFHNMREYSAGFTKKLLLKDWAVPTLSEQFAVSASQPVSMLLYLLLGVIITFQSISCMPFLRRMTLLFLDKQRIYINKHAFCGLSSITSLSAGEQGHINHAIRHSM